MKRDRKYFLAAYYSIIMPIAVASFWILTVIFVSNHDMARFRRIGSKKMIFGGVKICSQITNMVSVGNRNVI